MLRLSAQMRLELPVSYYITHVRQLEVGLTKAQIYTIAKGMAALGEASFQEGKCFIDHIPFRGIGQAGSHPEGHLVIAPFLVENRPFGAFNDNHLYDQIVVANCDWPPADSPTGRVDEESIRMLLPIYGALFAEKALDYKDPS